MVNMAVCQIRSTLNSDGCPERACTERTFWRKDYDFCLTYAEGSYVKFYIERCKGRLLGWARLLCGRWVKRTDAYEISPMMMARMYVVGARRLAGLGR